jgi:hypothetical protein
MPLSYSYPGIYIQELPLSTHTITPAPTSITAFVGYTHPWKTATFKTAIQLFSFSDYETYFGGLYTSGYFDNDVAQAVYAFFLNGGNNAYVVGLQPEALSAGPAVQFGKDPGDYAFQAKINPDPLILGVGMQFYALEPGDIVPMTATITQPPHLLLSDHLRYLRPDPHLRHTHRGLPQRHLTINQGLANSLDKRINGISTLVTVEPISGASYGTGFAYTTLPPTPPQPVNFALGTIVTYPALPAPIPASFTGSFSASDFINVFQANSSLDNVQIFNLLLVPGVSDNTVLSAALEFAERKRAFALLDPPPQATAFLVPSSGLPDIESLVGSIPTSQNGALYFPYLKGPPTPSAACRLRSPPAATSPASVPPPTAHAVSGRPPPEWPPSSPERPAPSPPGS